MATVHKEYINEAGDNYAGWALNDTITTGVAITTRGVVKLNNTTPSSVTQALIYDEDIAGTNYASIFQEIANLTYGVQGAEYKLIASVEDGLDPIDGAAADFVRWDINSVVYADDNLLLNLTHADGSGTNFVYDSQTTAINIYLRIYTNIPTETVTIQTVANQFSDNELFKMRITVFGEE